MRPKPYIRRLGIRDGVQVWLVDGCWIRDHLDVEFTNGAHHLSRRYVPLNEIWVDREARGAGELTFIIEHQHLERGFMLRGLSYEHALRRASRLERLQRRLARGLVPSLNVARRHVRRRALRPPRIFARMTEEIWLVEGRGVRDWFYPDFTQGGHGLRYRFIPRREIWIDDAVRADEREVVIIHEVVELGLMRGGLGYDEAHRRASEVEAGVRAGGAPPVLASLG